MTLREVMGSAAVRLPDVEVRALAFDNREVQDGSVFFCVRGFTRDGHEFAADAVARGAVALVVDHVLDGVGDIPQVVVGDVRAAMAPAAAALAGDPTATLTTVGVTGTNGKTTSAYLIRSLLQAGGHQTGMLGTVTNVIGGVQSPTVRTTPEAIELQRTFAEMLRAGDTHCVMEVSSHALALKRASAIHWAAAVFTNLTQDHLDFHPTMEDYFAAKRELFETASAQGAALVINVDDDHGARLAADFPQATTIAIESAADVRATDVSFGLTASTFTLDGVKLSCPLPGAFNVLNALGAVAVARALGVDDDAIARALPDAGRAPGRFEPVDEGQDFAVLVDYAHTPDSIENVLRAARALTPARVLIVFGAGGDRDRAKRPQMGAAAVEGADVVFVTSDNPRSEDPAAILAEIVEGMGSRAASVNVEADRRDAIQQAVSEARSGDVVVIAGKGHEQGQEFADGLVLPFDDVETAREAIRARLAA